MSKFKPGKELIEKLKIRNFEFYNDYIKRGLQPYNHLGRPIPPPDLSLKIFNIEKNLSDAEGKLEKKIFLIGPARIRVIKAVQDQLPTDLLEIEKRVETLKKMRSSITDYSWKDYSLPKSGKKAEKILADLIGYLYIEEEFLKIAEKHNLPLPDKETEEQPIKEVESQKSVDVRKDEIASSEYAFIKIGKFYPRKTYYDLIFNHQPIRLRGLGADYIYYLMRNYKHPLQIDIVELCRELNGAPEKDPDNKEFIKTIDKRVIEQRTSPDEEFVEVTDKKAIAQIREAYKDLEEEKEEAEKNNDYGRIETVNIKLEELGKYLSESTIQGRIKTFPSQKNKIIDRVRKAMGNTLSEIRKDNEEAYNHLFTAFKPLTSDPKSYKPTEDIPWKFN